MSDVAARIDAIEIGGRRLRVTETGQGPVLIHLAGARGSGLIPAHALLARRFRVLVFESPAPLSVGAAEPPEALAEGLAAATQRLGIEAFDLLGTSAGAPAAVALARHARERVRALVLEAPLLLDPARRDEALEHRLGELTVPTLVLLGTEDTVLPGAVGRAYKALIPGSHLVFVYAAGHAIAADRPEAFAEVVGDFLERHEAFVVSRARSVILP